jgi:uncharacterized protein (TIGR03118 family)
MKIPMSRSKRLTAAVLGVLALGGAGAMTWAGVSAQAAPTKAMPTATVLQTNLVSDLPGAAAVTDPNLVNSWGISESSGSPFWISDNNAGVSTLYSVPGAMGAAVTTIPLVVNIPTPVGPTGGTPSGTVFNTGSGGGSFKVTGPNNAGVTMSLPATFLFDSEDGTITGWNSKIDPTGKFGGLNGGSAQAVTAVDNSGNNFTNPDPNQQTGAVYKGLAIATSTSPIIPGDAASTSLLYASNFRAGTVDVYDGAWNKVTTPGAFTDRDLPRGYAPFNVQMLAGKIYVSYAKQDASKHDDDAGPGRGFVDVYNLDGSPGLAHNDVRLISRGALDSPWGLAITPAGFAGISSTDPVLLVGNFGNGWVNAYDAANGNWLDFLKDPDGQPIVIPKLWALQVGNGGAGGLASAVYFTAGIFDENHGLFGSFTTAAAGSPEGPAEAQWVQANLDVVQLDTQQLITDTSNGASADTIRQDSRTLSADIRQLQRVQRQFARDAIDDAR